MTTQVGFVRHLRRYSWDLIFCEKFFFECLMTTTTKLKSNNFEEEFLCDFFVEICFILLCYLSRSKLRVMSDTCLGFIPLSRYFELKIKFYLAQLVLLSQTLMLIACLFLFRSRLTNNEKNQLSFIVELSRQRNFLPVLMLKLAKWKILYFS